MTPPKKLVAIQNYYKNKKQKQDLQVLWGFFFFGLFRAALVAYGGSQARDLIGAVAASLCHSHSNVGSEPCLQPTPQLMATQDP